MFSITKHSYCDHNNRYFCVEKVQSMINARQKKILILAVRAGEIMLKSGAEIYRVEDTITRICKACKIPYVEVFVMPTGIFVSLDGGGDDSDMYTYIKRMHSGETDLRKISEINHFSREFTTTDLSVESGMKRLSEIDKMAPYPLVFRLLGAAIVVSGFSQLFGGGLVDFCFSFVIGGVSYLLSLILKRYSINFFIRGFCCCALAAFLGLLAASAVPLAHYGIIISGSLMIFVPGVAITNSIRDFLSGDMVSGLARMAEALLIAISLATGTGVVLKLWETVGGTLI